MMDWGYDDIPFDPGYPMGYDSDGLDPETRRELERIKRQQDRDTEYDDVPDLPI